MLIFQSAHSGKIKTESGVWIPKTYKSNRYAQWRENSKIDQQEEDNDSDEDEETVNNNKKGKFTLAIIVNDNN